MDKRRAEIARQFEEMKQQDCGADRQAAEGRASENAVPRLGDFLPSLPAVSPVEHVVVEVAGDAACPGDIAVRLPGNRMITMSNALARAGHGLTLPEKRLIGCAMAILDSKKPITPGKSPSTAISVKQYAEAYDLSSHKLYEEVRAATEKLYDRSINFQQRYTGTGKPGIQNVRQRWVQQAIYQPREGVVILHWAENIIPHLLALKQDFTSYRLKGVHGLRSIYSWRLLEILSSYKSTGWFTITVEEFVKAMDAPESYLKNSAALRRSLIEPAVKELREKDNWIIQYSKGNPYGRKWTEIRFDFQHDPQGKLF